jgi:hypothetical protein
MSGMDPRRIASIAAVVGGVGWLMKVTMIWGNGGQDTDSEPVAMMYKAGFAILAVAIGAAGYTLVETAPVWLRAVVAVATPLLVLMVWMLMDQAIKSVYPGSSWLRDEVSVVIAAVVALVMGVWGSGRHRPVHHEMAPTPHVAVRGRRAAR